MKRIATCLIVALSLSLCASPAFAHTKTFADYNSEYINLSSGFKEADTIYAACQNIIDAFESDDQEAITDNYKVIVDAGLMPEHYKLKDTSLIVPFRDSYKILRDKYNDEMMHNMECQGYWMANAYSFNAIIEDYEAGNSKIFPLWNTEKYRSNIIIGLPDDFFETDTDMTKYMGDIFLVKATMLEYHPDENCWFLTYESEKTGKRAIAVLNPNQYSSSLNYIVEDEVPQVGEEAYFCISFFLMREEDRLKIFYFGADDKVLDDLRLFGTPTDPVLKLNTVEE